MSEIQRYEVQQTAYGSLPHLIYNNNGAWCRYTDLLWYQRQYRMAVTTLALVCAVFAAYLAWDAKTPQPVAKKVPTVTLENTSKLAGLIDRYKIAKGEVERAQVKKKNPQQVEVAKPVRWAESYTTAESYITVGPTKMHDGQVAQLAREVGFSRIRVVE